MILVRELAALMLIVKWLTTIQFVVVLLGLLVIRSSDVSLYVSLKKNLTTGKRLIWYISEEEPVEVKNPCNPSPCGPNSQCREINGQPSCSCLPEFVGAPPNCKPECISNSECPNNLACISQKCKDPCPGICGQNAECRVISHTPNCVCLPGYVGNPFAICSQQGSICIRITTLQILT